MPDALESSIVPGPRFLVVLLSTLLAVALVPAAAAGPAALDRPSWSIGDYWTYATNTTLTPGLNLTGTLTSTVQGRVAAAAGGGSVSAFQVLVSGSGTARGTVATAGGNVSVQGTWILTGEERFDPTDLQPLYDLLDLSVNGTYQNLVPFSIRVQNTTSYQILSDSWQYPIAPGETGSVAAAYNFTQDFYGPSGMHAHSNGTGEWTFGFAMAASPPMATAAGTFPAYRVTETWPDGSSEVSFPSPQVGNDVRTEGYGPDGNLSSVTTLTAYRYQALETPTFLGLSALQWGIVVPVVAVAAAALFLFRRMRRRKLPRPPGGPVPPDLTSGPRGP